MIRYEILLDRANGISVHEADQAIREACEKLGDATIISQAAAGGFNVDVNVMIAKYKEDT